MRDDKDRRLCRREAWMDEVDNIIAEGDRTERGRKYLAGVKRGMDALQRNAHAAQEPPDALYDTSQDASADHLARFQRRVVESPLDRACQALSMAGDDLNAAICQAKSQHELVQCCDLILETIARLENSMRVANTLDAHWGQRKDQQ